MKKFSIVLLILIASVWSAGRNINGTTGYIVMPSAEGMRYQEYFYGLGAYSGTDVQKQHWKLLAGLGSSEGTEISIMGRSEREGFFANTKWFGTLGNYEDPLLVGVGFENISSLGTYGDYPNLFMVVTKKFLNGNSFSIGSTGRYIGRELVASMLCGTEIFSAPTVSWVGDIAAYETNRYNFSAGLRIYSTANSYFSVYAINAIRNGVVENELHPAILSIGYTLNNFM